jgi:3-oxoacyl-[acyl-carrier-protein] synthase II
MRPRTVISGAGPISALGVGIDANWDAMREGRSGLSSIDSFDSGYFSCQVAGEIATDCFKVRDIIPKSYRKASKVMCRDIELAMGAASAAILDAGLQTPGVDNEDGFLIPADRMGCHIGAGLIDRSTGHQPRG